MRKALCAVMITFLLAFSVSFVSAKTYEVVQVGAVHSYYDALQEADVTDVTPVYGTSVLQDNANGILRFKVIDNHEGYTQLLGASKNVADVGQAIDALPILKTLYIGDTVEINFKDCQYSLKSVTQINQTSNYLIQYVGQANSVTINAVQVPEFTNITAVLLSAMLAIILISLKLPLKKMNN